MKLVQLWLTYKPNPIERHRLTDEARREQGKQAAWFSLQEWAAKEPAATIVAYVDGEPQCGRVPA